MGCRCAESATRQSSYLFWIEYYFIIYDGSIVAAAAGMTEVVTEANRYVHTAFVRELQLDVFIDVVSSRFELHPFGSIRSTVIESKYTCPLVPESAHHVAS